MEVTLNPIVGDVTGSHVPLLLKIILSFDEAAPLRATSAVIVTVFDVTAVVIPLPPLTANDDVANCAVVVPESPVIVSYTS